MFNGVRVNSSVEADYGTTATVERKTPESYELELKLKVKVPTPNTTLAELSTVNPALPTVLPALEAMLTKAVPDPFFDAMYKRKVATIHNDLPRLNDLITRHNFFDCETILRLEHPQTKRKALLIQADMDIVMDGSDSDRVPFVDGSSAYFQPMTSYRWPKRGSVPNPFIAPREERILAAQTELPTAPPVRKEELQKLVARLKVEIADLRANSFLVSTVDPFVVVPGPLLATKGPFSPKLGDYCVVIFGDTIYPAIVGDVGPSYKAGEASLRLGKELNAKANAMFRPVSDLTVTYLVFPDTADKPNGPPDLIRWTARCNELLATLGGHAGKMHTWVDLVVPPPTPTPTPFPTVTPATTPSVTPTPTPEAISTVVTATGEPTPKLVPIKPTSRPTLTPRPTP